MLDLLKEYGFENVSEYYDMLIESFINGQKKQAREQFHAMPVEQRKDFLNELEDIDTMKFFLSIIY